MHSEKYRHSIQLTILLVGGILGWLFLSPLLPNKKENAILVGGLMALFINIIVFPNLRKKLFETPTKLRHDRLQKERSLGFRRYLFHPTNRPFHLSIALLFGSIAFLLATKIQPSEIYLSIGLIIILSLSGLSGFLMLIRNEYVDTRGRIVHGISPIINGLALLLWGWGISAWLLWDFFAHTK